MSFRSRPIGREIFGFRMPCHSGLPLPVIDPFGAGRLDPESILCGFFSFDMTKHWLLLNIRLSVSYKNNGSRNFQVSFVVGCHGPFRGRKVLCHYATMTTERIMVAATFKLRLYNI